MSSYGVKVPCVSVILPFFYDCFYFLHFLSCYGKHAMQQPIPSASIMLQLDCEDHGPSPMQSVAPTAMPRLAAMFASSWSLRCIAAGSWAAVRDLWSNISDGSSRRPLDTSAHAVTRS